MNNEPQTSRFLRDMPFEDEVLCVFRHPNGGIFAVDASYIEQVYESKEVVNILGGETILFDSIIREEEE